MSDNAEVSPTSTEQAAATPLPAEPEKAPVETAEKPGSEAQNKAAETAPSSDTFLSGDPNSLPPELRGKYDAMLTDYKKKTAAIAEVRKKAELFEQLSKDQKFVDYWNNLSQKQQTDLKTQSEDQLGMNISQEEWENAFSSPEAYVELQKKLLTSLNQEQQKRINELEQHTRTSKAANVIDDYVTENGADGKPLRPDFYDLDEDGLISGFLQVYPPKSEAEYRPTIEKAYQWAKSVSHKFYEKGKNDALTIIQKKVGTSSEMPTTTAKNVYMGKDPKLLTAEEAVALAKQGVRVR